jgi:hypothetical protein
VNVSNSVFYRNLCAFQPFVPSFCGGQRYSARRGSFPGRRRGSEPPALPWPRWRASARRPSSSTRQCRSDD